MSAVVPWLAADPARAAELLGEPREVVEHRLASLPAGSELVAPPGDGATLATGLLVLAEIPARGRGVLAWFSLVEDLAPERCRPLLAWAEARVRAAGATHLQVAERRAPGLGPGSRGRASPR
jgi:hypothetical protein